MSKRQNILAAALLSMAASAALTTPAFAHAHLRQADPAVGGTVHSAPPQLELTFSEAVEPSFCTVTVENEAGAQVDKHDLHVPAGDAKHLAIGLETLPAGTYKVTWHATAVDTHKTEGTFTFNVRP